MAAPSYHENQRTVLCTSCASIDTRRPFYGPLDIAKSSKQHTRILYELPKSITEIRASFYMTSCHLCDLILYTITKYNAREARTVVDDWDLLESWSDEDDDDNDCSIGDTGTLDDEYFLATSRNLDDITLQDSPILLDFTFRDRFSDESATRCVDVRLHWTQSEHGERISVPAFTLVVDLDDDIIDLSQKRDFSDDNSTSSNWSMDLASLWKQKCDNEHQMCRKRQQNINLPSRVVHVGDEKQRPRLIETDKLCTAEYACLSHCWGKGQPFKTESKSLAARMTGFEIGDVPKTFQDSIKICRRLGILYLWIDSLCIIQDSAEDWATQSALMGKIYRDASFTIFAESADSDTGGCFMPRNGKNTALCHTPMFDELASRLGHIKNEARPTFIQAQLHHLGQTGMPEAHHVFETVGSLESRLGKPLNTRGWVLQESILSFRSLVFDEYEVRWACPQMKACECLPEGWLRKTQVVRDSHLTTSSAIRKRDLHNSWLRIVEKFTERRLTFEKDKLPALAGLATQMAGEIGCTYLAGLWSDNLRRSLIWHARPRSTNAPEQVRKRPLHYRAPSWSWASVEGKLTVQLEYDRDVMRHEISELTCNVIDYKIVPRFRTNPMGELESGYLTVRGRLLVARCGRPMTNELWIQRIPVLKDCNGEMIGWFDPDITIDQNSEPILKIWLLPIHDFDPYSISEWLVLLPADTSYGRTFVHSADGTHNDCFVRVGVFSWKPSLSGRQLLEEQKLAQWFRKFSVRTVTIL